LRRPLKDLPFRFGIISHSAVIVKLNGSNWWLYEFGPEKEEGYTFIGPGKIHQYMLQPVSSETLRNLYFNQLVTFVPGHQEQPTYSNWKLHNAKNVVAGSYTESMLRQIMELKMPLRDSEGGFLYHLFHQNCHTAVKNLFESIH